MFETSHLHPMLVHFPIALALLGCLFEFIEIFFCKVEKKFHCGEYILYFATISAILAVMSGVFFTGNFTGKTLEVKETHAMLAFTTTTLLSIASMFYIATHFFATRSSMLRKIGLAFYVLSAIAVAITGLYGGTLVYNYMIGI